ncbi:MAG: hypothetical protein WKF31_07430 [Thermoleophilaceae bacterium]
MVPHPVVHCGREHERRRGRQRRGGEQVVGQPEGETGQGVGRGGRHGEHVTTLGELEMGDRVVVGRLLARKRAAGGVERERVGEHRRAGDPLEGGPSDEALARGGDDHADGVTGLPGQADELDRLVRGYPSRDAEEDPAHAARPLSHRLR